MQKAIPGTSAATYKQIEPYCSLTAYHWIILSMSGLFLLASLPKWFSDTDTLACIYRSSWRVTATMLERSSPTL